MTFRAFHRELKKELEEQHENVSEKVQAAGAVEEEEEKKKEETQTTTKKKKKTKKKNEKKSTTRTKRLYLQQALYDGIGKQIKKDFSRFHWAWIQAMQALLPNVGEVREREKEREREREREEFIFFETRPFSRDYSLNNYFALFLFFLSPIAADDKYASRW